MEKPGPVGRSHAKTRGKENLTLRREGEEKLTPRAQREEEDLTPRRQGAKEKVGRSLRDRQIID